MFFLPSQGARRNNGRKSCPTPATSLQFLARLEIPEAQLTGARASALFDAVHAAFIAEAWHPEAASFLPIPPPPLGDGFKVELLRLLLAVRARGGFADVASLAAIAEDVDRAWPNQQHGRQAAIP